VVAMTVVVTHEQLVSEHRCEQLGAVVVEASMPDTLIQLKERLEPLVEWFDGLLASRIDASPAAAAQERAAFAAELSAARLLGVCRGSQFPALGIARVLRAQETPTSSSPLLVKLQPLAILIHVVAAVGRYGACANRQLGDLVRESARLAGAGRGHRSQERKDGMARRRGHHHLVAVAMHPIIVLGIAPRAVTVDPRRDLARSPILPMPRRTPHPDPGERFCESDR